VFRTEAADPSLWMEDGESLDRGLAVPELVEEEYNIEKDCATTPLLNMEDIIAKDKKRLFRCAMSR